MNEWIAWLQDSAEQMASGYKAVFLVASGLTAVLLTSDVFVNLLLALAAITALIWYRLKRRFKDGKVHGLWDFLDRNIVEIGLILTAAPNGWKVAFAVIRSLNVIP